MPPNNPPNHLQGLGVGIYDEPKMENAQDLGQHFRPDGTLDPTKLDPATGALVVAFKAWLGIGGAGNAPYRSARRPSCSRHRRPTSATAATGTAG